MGEHKQDGVAVGMAIAAGIIMAGWGNDVYAAEILGAAGLTTEDKMREAGVDDYDIELCRPVLEHMTATGGQK